MLKKHRIKPRDRYSQSFVINPSLVQDIVNEVKRISCGKTVTEIGSGLGVITYYLSLNHRVIAIEIDRKLALITGSIVNKMNCIVVNGDALYIEWLTECIVSNTPYHISSELLIKLARTNKVRKAVLVLQKEVVDRLIAKPGTKNYGRLTIIINLLFNIEKKTVYPPSFFYPKPKVYSQLVVLERRKLYDDNISILEEVTRTIFSERRKKAIRVLEKKLGIRRDDAKKIGINEETRVYQVEPRVLMEIVKLVKQRRSI